MLKGYFRGIQIMPVLSGIIYKLRIVALFFFAYHPKCFHNLPHWFSAVFGFVGQPRRFGLLKSITWNGAPIPFRTVSDVLGGLAIITWEHCL